MRSNASLILSSGIVCVTNSSTFSFPAMYSSTNFGTLSQLFQPVHPTKLAWNFRQTHAQLGENRRFKILGECSVYNGSRFWGERKPEFPEKTLEVRLRSTETLPTDNICSRGGRRDWCPLRQPDFPAYKQKRSIDLFSLYVLFSHFRPRDALMEICLLFFH